MKNIEGSFYVLNKIVSAENPSEVRRGRGEGLRGALRAPRRQGSSEPAEFFVERNSLMFFSLKNTKPPQGEWQEKPEDAFRFPTSLSSCHSFLYISFFQHP